MLKRKQNETIHDDGTYVVKKNRKMNLVAGILCVLIAFLIWIYASNVENKNKDIEQASPQVVQAHCENEIATTL